MFQLLTLSESQNKFDIETMKTRGRRIDCLFVSMVPENLGQNQQVSTFDYVRERIMLCRTYYVLSSLDFIHVVVELLG